MGEKPDPSACDFSSLAQDRKSSHNLQSAESIAPWFVGAVWIVAILLELVCDAGHTAFAMDLQVL